MSAFGGDQFLPSQTLQLQQFFSFFYISINAGSLISTFITPILRADVSCFGREDCFPLAFGVPAVLMVLAVVLFIIGKFLTHYKINPPQGDNIIFTVLKCVFVSFGYFYFWIPTYFFSLNTARPVEENVRQWYGPKESLA